MTFDGITTKAIIDEISPLLIGGKINKINQINKDTLIFQIYNKKNYSLLISANSSHSRIHLTENKYENPMVAPDFSMILRKHLQAGTIIDIKQISLDRTIFIYISAHDEMGYETTNVLAIELMGRHSNIVLLNNENIVYDSIKRVTLKMSSVRQILPKAKYEIFGDDKENILEEYKNISELDIKDSTKLYKIFYMKYTGFSPLIGMEICFNANLDPDRRFDSLSKDELNMLENEFNKIIKNIRDSNFSPTIYLQGERYTNVYAFKLKHLPNETKLFESISKAIDEFFTQTARVDKLGQGIKKYESIIKLRLEKENKKYIAMSKQYEETKNIDSLRKEGDLLSAYAYLICKGDDNLNVLDYNTNEYVDIKIDPRKTPWENIEQKYKKASKLKKSKNYLDKSVPIIKSNIEYLNQLLLTLTQVTTVNELDEIKVELEDAGLIKKNKKKAKKKESFSKPLHYVYRNYDIFVGKNNRQNDELTFKLANKDDYFIHVKGSTGAHVILRSDKNPDDSIKYVAAWLAATHSSEANANIVQVDITEKKNVGKAKGAQPGMVYYTNYETINVDTNDEFKFDSIN